MSKRKQFDFSAPPPWALVIPEEWDNEPPPTAETGTPVEGSKRTPAEALQFVSKSACYAARDSDAWRVVGAMALGFDPWAEPRIPLPTPDAEWARAVKPWLERYWRKLNSPKNARPQKARNATIYYAIHGKCAANLARWFRRQKCDSTVEGRKLMELRAQFDLDYPPVVNRCRCIERLFPHVAQFLYPRRPRSEIARRAIANLYGVSKAKLATVSDRKPRKVGVARKR